MSSPTSSPRPLPPSTARALAVVTNKWYREQRRAEQEATRRLTLLKQRKISCIIKAESLVRGVEESVGDSRAGVEEELREVERSIRELEGEREARAQRISERRAEQVSTLQELGLLEAAGSQGGMWRELTDLDQDHPKLSPASRKLTPPLPLGARLRTGSDPSICRPDPSSRLDRLDPLPARLEPSAEDRSLHSRGLASRLSPRLGRRNPLRMLSNAMDFRTRRKTRPKSADCSAPEEARPPPRPQAHRIPPSPRSASVTDLLESVSLSPNSGQQALRPAQAPGGRAPLAPMPRPLEGHNSAPDLLPGRRPRGRLSAAASAKQKLSTRFQPQRKAQHRTVLSNGGGSSAVRRAKTFSLGAQAPGHTQPAYKTLPKQASSRSLGSSSTDSSQGSQSTASSRKSSNSSSLSTDSSSASAKAEISRGALEEIAAFERFIEDYFDLACDNNNLVQMEKMKAPLQGRISASSSLSEVLELSI